MPIGAEEARRVAHLARIRVEEGDLEGIAAELSAIVGFMEKLREVDVEGVEPMTSVTPMELKRRPDAAEAGPGRDGVLSNAPETRQGFFAVPKVVE